MSEQATQIELERLRKTFLRQAKTFRASAKMLSKDANKEMETKLCKVMADVSEGFAKLVTKEMGKP